MDNLIDLDEHRTTEHLYTVMAMCLPCYHRWIGGVRIETSLFGLECPRCGAQESFATFVPPDYSADLMDLKGSLDGTTVDVTDKPDSP